MGIPRWNRYEVYLPQLREAFEARGLREYFFGNLRQVAAPRGK